MSILAELPAIWHQPAQTLIHRHLIQAFAQPGTIQDLTDCLDEAPAYLGVLATLADRATSLADPYNFLSVYDRSLLGATDEAIEAAAFVLASGSSTVPVGFTLRTGTLVTPEFGASLLLCVDGFDKGLTLDLAGPGIDGRSTLDLMGCDPSWLVLRAQLCAFPLGIDIIFCCGKQIAAVPRSTRVTWEV